jgi:aminoglycoside phosphotransferase (APT) family kinase protein
LREAFVVEGHLGRIDGGAVVGEVRHLGVAHEIQAATHGRLRIAGISSGDIVETAANVQGTKPPLVVLDRVRAFLDEHGLGSGDLRARRIGEGGGSNFTFLLERDSDSFVLRRPPRPPLPPSAHDVVREAKLQLALSEARFGRLPTIAAVCEDDSLLGVPFYVMTFLDGFVPTDEAPPGLETESERRALGDDLVDALVEIHAADVTTPGLAAFARPGSYNERQVRRFAQLWGHNKTRAVPRVEEVGAWLADHVPDPLPPTVVHGDFRLGNTMVGQDYPTRILAVLDWEMGAIGDPRADVGYLLATYSEPGGPSNPLGTSPITALDGFPSRAELVQRYVARSGRNVEPLAWFEGLALWKAAIFCEAIYGRFVRGELGAEDTRAARFEQGVPYLADAAAEAISR